jgi:hypothetical protein
MNYDAIAGILLAAVTFVAVRVWNPYIKRQSPRRAFLEAAAVALFAWFMWWGFTTHADYCEKHPDSDVPR